MIIIDGTSEIEYAGKTKIAIGKFDGVHLGHRKLISEITKPAEGYKSLVFTFSYDSSLIYNKEKLLLSEEKRCEIFEKLGVDYLVEYKLDKENASIDPTDFVKDILCKKLHAGLIAAGEDVSFGYMGKGNADLLCKLSKELDFEVEIIDKVKYKGEDISSSRIKEAIENGNNIDADRMLCD